MPHRRGIDPMSAYAPGVHYRGARLYEDTPENRAWVDEAREAEAAGPLPEIDEVHYAPDAVDIPNWEDFVAAVYKATVNQVRENVESGDWDLADVVAAENEGRKRATVLALS